jgi:hypothetical protein
MPTELERRARELFEAWLDRQPAEYLTITAEQAGGKSGDDRYLSPSTSLAWNAWQAALQAQQPGAQAVEPYAYEFYKLMFDSMGGWERRIEHNLPLRHDDPSRIRDIKPLYTHPQPPSISEPSEDDVDAAYAAFCAAWTKTKREQVADILTTYTARLRERIGRIEQRATELAREGE